MEVQTLHTQDIIEISLETSENLDALLSLISGKVSEENDLSNCYIFALFCELVWINSSILRILRRDMQEPSFKDETQKEVFIDQNTLTALSSLMLARWQAMDELNKFSYSLSLH